MTEEIDVLVIDDEVNILNSLRRVFMGEKITMYTLSDPKETFEILKQKKIKVVLVDERMPYISGLELLKKIKELYPNIVRILFTGFSEMKVAEEAVNEAAIYRIITKPWNDTDLKNIIQEAIKKYDSFYSP